MNWKTTPRALLVVLLCACCALPALAETEETGRMDYGAFTQLYLDALAQKAPEAQAELQEDGAILVTENGQSLSINPLNAYAEYLAGHGEAEDIVEHYVSAVLSVLREEMDNELTRENVMPVIKPLSYLDFLAERDVEGVYDPFVEGLMVLYVMDTPTAVRPIQVEELEKAGIDRDELRALAVENLTKALPPLTMGQTDNIHIVAADGMYEASLLLLDLDEIVEIDVAGDYVVAVPARDAMLIAGSEDEESVAILRGFAPTVYESSGYPVTDRLLRWTGTEYEWFE